MSETMQPRPAFQVEKQTGTFKRTIMRFVEDVKLTTDSAGNEKKRIMRRMEPQVEEYQDRYMLYFPLGHSMAVDADDEEQLQRLGVLGRAPLVDLVSGEIIPEQFHLDNKDIVQRKTKNRPRPQTGGLTELEQELTNGE